MSDNARLNLLMLDGKTRIVGVVGDPVEQVRSPLPLSEMMQNAGFNAIQLPFHVTPQDLRTFAEGMKRVGNLAGLVFTVPHKIAAVDLVDRLTPVAEAAGSVNAIRREADGLWLGDNFDGAGFVSGLQAEGHQIEGRSAFVAGVGGAGTAICAALAQAGISSLRIFDIAEARTKGVKERLGRHFPSVNVEILRLPDPSAVDIAINATALGMGSEDPLPFGVEELSAHTVVAEVVMKPPVTRLLRLAEEAGHRVCKGENVMLYQLKSTAQFFEAASTF